MGLCMWMIDQVTVWCDELMPRRSVRQRHWTGFNLSSTCWKPRLTKQAREPFLLQWEEKEVHSQWAMQCNQHPCHGASERGSIIFTAGVPEFHQAHGQITCYRRVLAGKVWDIVLPNLVLLGFGKLGKRSSSFRSKNREIMWWACWITHLKHLI